MPIPDLEPQVVRRQLDRALASPSFARSERQSRFLRFVVERHLEGRDDELKESVIALEVFGDHDYDPKQDSIVRTEAGRLRARLAEYYVGPGSGEPVVFELPKGGYVPVFRRIENAPVPAKTRSLLPWLLPAFLGCVIAVGAFVWWRVHSSGAPIAIAVLPLQNLNQDQASDYFADGLTDEVIRNLSIIDGLAVRSQTSSFAFKGKPRNLHDVGKQLAADYILEGSVLRSGKQLRIDVQLVRVRDDITVWSDKYDKELTDVFAIQEEISHGIVNSLRLKLGRGRRRYETSLEAYDFYLRARALEIENLSPLSGSDQSIDFYQEALGKDPAFAPAYAGLAMAYAFRSGTMRGLKDDDITKMRAAAEKAVKLDPLSGEAHSALTVVDCSADSKAVRRIYLAGGELESAEREEFVWGSINLAFSEPVTRTDDVAEYAPTQVLAEAFRSVGYEGIVYGSKLGSGKTVAVFDLDAAEPANGHLYRVDGISLKFSIAAHPYCLEKYRKTEQPRETGDPIRIDENQGSPDVEFYNPPGIAIPLPER